MALRSLREYAPDAATLAEAVGMQSDPALARKVYDRIVEKLEREPVEDFRLDFEDGYGNRPDDEEDQHANSQRAGESRAACGRKHCRLSLAFASNR